MKAWFEIIFGMLYILAGIVCLFVPNHLKSWINKQPVVLLRLLGIAISLTGVLIVMQLLALDKLCQLLVTLTQVGKK